MVTLMDMYVGMVNSPEATLSASVTDTDLVIPITACEVFPATGNGLASIGPNDDAETIKYAYKTALSGPGNLIVLQRAFNTSGTYGVAKAWPAGTVISRQYTEYDMRAATTNIETLSAQFGTWTSFDPSPVWSTATPTITSTVARCVRTGNVVTFAISFMISNGLDAVLDSLTLPVAAPQTANYYFPLIAFKKITSGGSSLMSDPFGYIDYTLATPVIKFSQFGTLPSGYTAELRISGSYEVA